MKRVDVETKAINKFSLSKSRRRTHVRSTQFQVFRCLLKILSKPRNTTFFVLLSPFLYPKPQASSPFSRYILSASGSETLQQLDSSAATAVLGFFPVGLAWSRPSLMFMCRHFLRSASVWTTRALLTLAPRYMSPPVYGSSHARMSRGGGLSWAQQCCSGREFRRGGLA